MRNTWQSDADKAAVAARIQHDAPRRSMSQSDPSRAAAPLRTRAASNAAYQPAARMTQFIQPPDDVLNLAYSRLQRPAPAEPYAHLQRQHSGRSAPDRDAGAVSDNDVEIHEVRLGRHAANAVYDTRDNANSFDGDDSDDDALSDTDRHAANAVYDLADPGEGGTYALPRWAMAGLQHEDEQDELELLDAVPPTAEYSLPRRVARPNTVRQNLTELESLERDLQLALDSFS